MLPVLEDLFKISLDSNNKSLRDFASIILEGKQLTTRIQGDPDSKISTLTTEDLSWRVLGINAQGQLELISADPTSQTLYLANDEGYVKKLKGNRLLFCVEIVK